MSSSLLPRTLARFGSACLVLLLGGCFETTQDFTVNPDGSGKVVHESTFQNLDLMRGKSTGDAPARNAALELIRKAKGVDAWRDVSYNVLEDGRIHFKGTAYFRNLSELDLPNQTMLEFDWKPGTAGGATLALRQKPNAGSAAKAKSEKLTAEERARKIKEGRAKYQQAKPMMTMILGAMKQDVTFHLPGREVQHAGFTKDASGALTLRFDGARMLSAMETLLNNDDWIARNSASFDSEGGGPPMDEDANLLMFGDKRPVGATIAGPVAPLFDYAAEVAAAHADSAALEKELGGPAPVAKAPAAQGGELKAVRVVGLRVVGEVDESLELQPFGTKAGIAVSLLAELPGSVHALTDECVLESAVGSDGSDLLPESEFDRKIHFPKLSADKASVLLEGELRPAPDGVTVLKELTGRMQYTVAGDATLKDLGFAKFAAGAKGKELGAEIVSIAAADGGGKDIELRLQIDPNALKGVHLVRGQNKSELESRGYSATTSDYGSGVSDCRFHYFSAEGFPNGSRLVAEVYGDLQTFDASFRIENVPLPALPK